MMRIGVVSDTHGNRTTTAEAIELLKARNVVEILHCGDIVSPSIIWLLADWPTHYVMGNCDGDPELLRAAMHDAGMTCHGRFGELERAGRKIAFLHGDDSRQFRHAVSSGEYDLVCYGHTHEFRQEQTGRTLVLNPGALHRARPRSFAVVDLEQMHVEFVPLSDSE